MANKEKGKVAIDRNFSYLSLIDDWSIFYGNFMVTVISSVEHECSDWSMWFEKKLLPSVQPISASNNWPGGLKFRLIYTHGILLSTKFFADVFNVIMFWGIRVWRIYSWLPHFAEILHVELNPADFESQVSLLQLKARQNVLRKL